MSPAAPSENVSPVMESGLHAWRDCVLERMRVLIVAGVTTGALVAGLVSRFAMLLLRVTSPERVNGLQSDDDFTIGRFTLAGTYNLVVLGAFVGILGFCVYRLVKPWLLGPLWFRRATLGIASGIVAGSMLVHADGIDFTVLKPKWLAISLFIALPALFAVVMGVVVDSVSRSESWTARGPWRWLLPVIVVACVPVVAVFLAFALIPVGVWALSRDVDFPAQVRSVSWLPFAVRGAWLLIVALGLAALVTDVTALI